MGRRGQLSVETGLGSLGSLQKDTGISRQKHTTLLNWADGGVLSGLSAETHYLVSWLG